MSERDRQIARRFEPLRDRLKDLTKDLSGLKLELVSGRVEEIRGLLHSYEIGVVVRVDADTVVEIAVDSAGRLGDNWYFLGPPEVALKITRGGKSKLVNIMTGNEVHWVPVK